MKIDAGKFKEALENAGYDPRSYSGRCMYGKNCIGVTCENVIEVAVKALASMIAEEGEEDVWGLAEAIGRARTDSMGLSSVIYWPSIEWVDNEEECEKDDL